MPSLFLPKQIHLEFGGISELANIVEETGEKKVLVVMDAFLAQEPINLNMKVKRILEEQNISVAFFSDFRGEPNTVHLNKALNKLNEAQASCIIAIGGGSAIDLAKAIAVFGKNPNLDWDEIVGRKRLARLPLIAIPTTAGTGSEVTKVMVITNTETNIKMNPGHPSLIPDIAILDPELTMSLPQNFTVYTGIDALAHAMEAYVSTRSSVLSDHYALEAIKMAGDALPKVYKDGNDREARKNMLLASCYAGVAFSNASTNLAHATARPLGARFHIPHGLSVALLLPFVIEFGLEIAEDRYSKVSLALGGQERGDNSILAKQTLEIVDSYNEQFNVWKDGLSYIELENLKESIPILVEDSLSGNGITTNPKLPSYKDVQKIFESLYHKLSITSISV